MQAVEANTTVINNDIKHANDEGLKLLNCLYSSIDEAGTRFEGKAMPPAMLAAAKALVFLTTTKIGAGIGVSSGHGFVIAIKPNGGWSNPVFLSTKGLQIGAVLGVEKIQSLMVGITHGSALDLVTKKQSNFGSDIAFKVFTSGVDDFVNMTQHTAWAVATYGQGAIFDFSLGGGVLSVDASKNAKVYGADLSPEDVLNGKTVQQHGMEDLYHKIRAIGSQATY